MTLQVAVRIPMPISCESMSGSDSLSVADPVEDEVYNMSELSVSEECCEAFSSSDESLSVCDEADQACNKNHYGSVPGTLGSSSLGRPRALQGRGPSARIN